MWGICLDAEILSADLLQNLFQRVVEYEVDANDGKAVILAPQCGIRTDLKNIKKLKNPPRFRYGERVVTRGEREYTGTIAIMQWHFNRGEIIYKIKTDNGKIKSKRYFESDLNKL